MDECRCSTRCKVQSLSAQYSLTKCRVLSWGMSSQEWVSSGNVVWVWALKNSWTALRLCRFMTVEGTSKNRIISPGKVLHFYNSPPDSTVESLNEVFTKVGLPPPNGVKFFSQGEHHARGMLRC